MIKAFGIAALLAGALSILPSTAHADPCDWDRNARRERVEREQRQREEDRELVARLHARRTSFFAQQQLQRERFAGRWGWEPRHMAEFNRHEAIERARFEDGLRQSWWVQHERIQREGPHRWD